MKKIMLVLALAACNGQVNLSNRAMDYATSLEPKAACRSWGTSHDGDVDAALCKVDDVLYKCVAGVSQDPKCAPLIDLNVERRAQRAAAQAAQPAPAAPAVPPTQH
jgi:hypothetical protein